MHIADAALTTEAMVATNVVAATGVGYGLYRLDVERIPRVGILAATFFVASFVHIRVGPSSVHLLLNGLVGVLLGWSAFPAIAAALLLQAILLAHGGLTTLGANTLAMAVPAATCYYVCGGRSVTWGPRVAFVRGALAGGLAVALSCLATIVALHLGQGESFRVAIRLIVVGHAPVLIIESTVTGAAIAFLARVKPEVLPGYTASRQENQENV